MLSCKSLGIPPLKGSQALQDDESLLQLCTCPILFVVYLTATSDGLAFRELVLWYLTYFPRSQFPFAMPPFVHLVICIFHWVLPALLPAASSPNQSFGQAVLVIWKSLGGVFVTGRSFSYHTFSSVPYIALCWRNLSLDQAQL